MKNLNLLMLGLLLIPFAAVMNLGNAFAETATVIIAAGAQTQGCETEDKCWDPSTITVPIGTTVTWKNKDGAGHTVTGATDPKDPSTWSSITTGGNKFDSTVAPNPFLIAPEKEWSFTFTEKGEFPYVCQVHPHMIGKVIVTGEAPPPEGALILKTDNSSVNVEVTTDKGMVHGTDLMVDPPQQITFNLRFLDPTTGKPIQHLNYQFHVADASGGMIAHDTENHLMDGTDSKSVEFSNTGSYTLMLVVEGTGTSEPYDETKYSGTASSMVTVTPEFPLGVMAVMAAVVGIGIAATRFKNPIKL